MRAFWVTDEDKENALVQVIFSTDLDADFNSEGFNAAWEAVKDSLPDPDTRWVYLEINGGEEEHGGYLEPFEGQWSYMPPTHGKNAV